MDNFDFKKYLAENKLHEAMFDVATTEKIAQQVADAFTAEDNELDLKYVVTPGTGENSFDLDVEAGPNTPGEDWKDENGFGIDNYLGQYAGGSFYIKDGVVYNAASRNAPVAKVSPEGEVEMISAEDSRADLDAIDAQRKKETQMANVFVREGDLIGNIGKGLDYEETLDKIKDYADRLLGADVEDVEDLMDFYLDNPADLPEPLEYNFFKNNYDDILYYATTGKDELGEGKVEKKSNKMKKSELKEMIKAAMLAEAEKEDIEVTDAEEIDVDTDAETADAGEVDVEADAEVEMTGDTKEVQDNLQAALEAAKALGDQKLVDQIGNSITFFTRTHVVGKGEVAEATEIEEIELSGDFPMLANTLGISIEAAKYLTIATGLAVPVIIAAIQAGGSALVNYFKKIAAKKSMAEGSIDVDVDSPAEDAEVGMELNESVNRMKKLAGLI